MEDFFGSMYCIFEDFFGLDLADYLWGEATDTQTTNMYVAFGLWMIVVSAVFMVLYYYIFNHPRWNTVKGWLTFLLVNAFVNFMVGWLWLVVDYNNGNMVNLNIGEGNLLCFGVTNAIISIPFFIILSLAFHWWSSNCSRTPFKKF